MHRFVGRGDTVAAAPGVDSVEEPSGGFLLVDPDGRCIDGYIVAHGGLGLDASGIRGEIVWTVLHHLFGAAICDELRDKLQSGARAHLGDHQTADGRHISVHYWPAERGGVFCLSDVTARKSALHQAFAERCRIENLLAVVAHELRNPLASIANAIALLDGQEEARKQAEAMLRHQLQYFSRVVEDLLDISGIAHGHLAIRPERLSVRALVEHALASVMPLALQKSLQVRTAAEDLTIYGDATRLEQVLLNLLRNAVACTDPGGSIYITAERSERDVQIRVSDTGCGIPPERLPYLFDAFYGYWPNGSNGGRLGIGLGVVRRIVELHGGSVTAHSEGPGRGAEFVVRLPHEAPRV